MEIVKIQMPDVEVYCPECVGQITVSGLEFEVNSPKYYGVAEAFCGDCDKSFTVGLV